VKKPRSSRSESAPKKGVRDPREETPFEAIASICSVLVIGFFILTLLAENYLIPSGSMQNTLLIGDHLLADRITFAPPSNWMPLMHYREPRRGDIVIFLRPAPEPLPDAEGKPQYQTLVKRLIGVPGDRIHLRDGTLYVNGVAQAAPPDGKVSESSDEAYMDNFPSILPTPEEDHGAVESWVVELPNHVDQGDLIVPPGKYFMMGDNRHGSYDSRYWGLVPRENIIGRPLFNYWSFVSNQDDFDQTGLGNRLAWMGHVLIHFFSDTRWSRTFHLTR